MTDATTAFVIVPGIGMSHRYGVRLHDALRRTSTAFSLDLPGFAGAPPTAETNRMSVTELAESVGATLDGHGIDRAVLVGHSMGSQFVVELARLRPSLVSRLVLMAPVVDPSRSTARQQATDLVRDLVTETPKAAAIVTVDYLRTRPHRFTAALRSMLDYRTDDAIRDVHCPVLVIRGENDPIARRDWCEQLMRSAPDARLVEVAGAGHLLQYTASSRVTREILAFAADDGDGANPQITATAEPA